MKLGCYELDTIVQGNAHELIKQVPTASVDCVYTDPPYLFQQGGSGSSPLALRVKKHKAELESNGIWSGFDYSIFAEFVRVMRNINCFIWCSKEQVYPILDWWCKNTNATYQILTWNKTNPAPMCNGNWLSDIEYCLYFNRGTKLNDGIEHKSKWYTSAINVKDKGKWGHLAIKPLELVERHLRHTTMGGGIVLDPFAGSGTTAVACKNLGRHFLGFEISERWHKVATDRLNNTDATGQMSFITF